MWTRTTLHKEQSETHKSLPEWQKKEVVFYWMGISLFLRKVKRKQRREIDRIKMVDQVNRSNLFTWECKWMVNYGLYF